MNDVKTPFQGKSYTDVISTSYFDIRSMKSLFAILEALSKEAAELHIKTLVKQENQSRTDFNAMKEYGKGLLKLKVFITSDEGDVYSAYDQSLFDDANIPSSLKSIVFDSSPDHLSALNKRPNNWLRLELNLSRSIILDLTASPSEPTQNGSILMIEGADNNWTTTALTKIRKALSDYKTNRGLLHQRNVYDVYIFAFGLPIVFVILSRLNDALGNFLSSLNSIQQTFVFIYFFLLSLAVFRLFFNYARWVFPYIEFDMGKGKRKLHRTIWWFVFSTIVAGITWQSTVFIWGKIFK